MYMLGNPHSYQELAPIFGDVGRWSRKNNTLGYIMTDPLTLDPINPNQPPEWITDEGILRGGLRYLRRNADKLLLTIYFGEHATAGSLGNLQDEWYEKQVKDADFYAYESSGHNPHKMQLIKEYMSTMQHEVLVRGEDSSSPVKIAEVASRKGHDTFQARQYAAALLLGTPSFAMDYHLDDGTPAEQALLTTLIPNLTGADREKAALAYTGNMNAREWIGVARLGAELKDIFGSFRAPLRGFVTFGGAHEDLVRKLWYQGVEPEVVMQQGYPGNHIGPYPMRYGAVDMPSMPPQVQQVDVIRDRLLANPYVGMPC
jgi:hypothetical protein